MAPPWSPGAPPPAIDPSREREAREPECFVSELSMTMQEKQDVYRRLVESQAKAPDYRNSPYYMLMTNTLSSEREFEFRQSLSKSLNRRQQQWGIPSHSLTTESPAALSAPRRRLKISMSSGNGFIRESRRVLQGIEDATNYRWGAEVQRNYSLDLLRRLGVPESDEQSVDYGWLRSISSYLKGRMLLSRACPFVTTGRARLAVALLAELSSHLVLRTGDPSDPQWKVAIEGITGFLQEFLEHGDLTGRFFEEVSREYVDWESGVVNEDTKQELQVLVHDGNGQNVLIAFLMRGNEVMGLPSAQLRWFDVLREAIGEIVGRL